MAEEHLNTTPEGPEAPGEELKPQDFTSEIDSQLTQLISLAELVRKMEDAGSGAGDREGFFYGIADIIEGCADRIESMVKATYDHMYDLGETRALEKAQKNWAVEATVLRETAKELEEMADYLVKLRQEPEIEQQAEIFIKGMGGFRLRFENYLNKAFMPVEEEVQFHLQEIPKFKKILSGSHYCHIESIRRHIESRADRLIQNPGSPLVPEELAKQGPPLSPEEVARIGQEIKLFAGMINESLAI
ncbi:MAG: hypothetical protein HY913_00015 [Desulfomonile tiedjei]|nr:hypothetical protein [Desulfomonile tiedjei]